MSILAGVGTATFSRWHTTRPTGYASLHTTYQEYQYV